MSSERTVHTRIRMPAQGSGLFMNPDRMMIHYEKREKV
jgi:hypothetical protein